MKDGTWAYRPAGRKNWQAVLASRPEDHKKVDRETRTLYAVNDEVIRQHLTGKKTIGIYPLLVDETCWLLAADFDKATWQEDSLAFLATCKRAGIPSYLEGGFGNLIALPLQWMPRQNGNSMFVDDEPH